MVRNSPRDEEAHCDGSLGGWQGVTTAQPKAPLSMVVQCSERKRESLERENSAKPKTTEREWRLATVVGLPEGSGLDGVGLVSTFCVVGEVVRRLLRWLPWKR